jgi:hypothetical protein
METVIDPLEAANADIDTYTDSSDKEIETASSKRNNPIPNIAITVYGWEWHNVAKPKSAKQSNQGNWHVDPQNCFQQAIENKPEYDGQEYELETFRRVFYFDITRAFIDAAFSKLIHDHIMQDKADRMSYMNPESVEMGDDYDIYGVQAFHNIEMGQVLKLCKKGVAKYQEITHEMNMYLMEKVASYHKSLKIFDLIRDGYLSKYFVDLFEYIGE